MRSRSRWYLSRTTSTGGSEQGGGGEDGRRPAPRTIEAPRVDHFPSGRLVYFLSGARI
jgi:hypothetical protein